MALIDCRIDWDAGAVLQELVELTPASDWVGQQIYNGTIAGAVKLFQTLPRERQERIDMFVEAGRVADAQSTILGFHELTEIAGRGDLPN